MSKRRIRPSKLKPCPFCGHKTFTRDCVTHARARINGLDVCLTAIECPKCKAIGPPSDGWCGEAVRWNKRTFCEELQSVHEVWADVPELIKEINKE